MTRPDSLQRLNRLRAAVLMALASSVSATWSQTEPAPEPDAPTLPAVRVRAATDAPGDAPRPYAGGQVARGGSVGLLGNVDFMDAPFSVQSYTADTIRQLGARSPLDVLTLDPSFTRAIGVVEGTDQFTARGFVQFGYQAYQVNGLPGLAATQGNDADLYERIEVIRGPTALVNGGIAASNVGTTVNLVTKKAPDEGLLRVTSRLESRSLWTNQIDAGRRFGSDNAFGIRINALHTDGHRNDDIESGFKRRLGSVDLDYRGERLRGYVHLYSLNYRTDPYGSVNPLTLDAPDPTLAPPRVIALGGNAVESTQSAAQTGVEWDLAPHTTLALAYGRKRSHTEQPYSGLSTLDPATGDATQANGRYVDRGRNSAYDATLRTRLQTGAVSHRLAVNASRSQSEAAYAYADGPAFDTNIYRQIAGPAAPDVTPGPIVSTGQTSSAGVVDMLGFFDDTLLLTLGARHVRIEQSSDNDGDSVIETFYGKSKTTPGFALLLKLSRTVSLYGNRVEALEQGQQAPFNTGAPADFVSNPGQVFGPTQAQQWEVGAKWDLDRRIALTAAAFHIERPSFFRDAVTRFYGPQGQQTNRGIELGAAGQPGVGVRLLGGYAFIDAELSQTGDAATDGKTAVGVPKHTLTLSGEWDLAAVPGLTLVARMRSQSRQQADALNTQQAPGVTVGGLGFNVALPWAKAVVVRGFVDNVGDKRYFPSLSRGRYDQAAPRTYSLSLQADL